MAPQQRMLSKCRAVCHNARYA